ncbi:Sec1-like protein [Neolentinus lepideus HHB14362 ss-1]|uniref:Sec1-like protein n=1 Tax=Neolentinus lepideus HHB14362 ss-1 TaxID=1314782 RepID=A0A165WB99_9AGAM|nr:Sec1-like protein [Neolentinus lepideus HHB14362 ss-1]
MAAAPASVTEQSSGPDVDNDGLFDTSVLSELAKKDLVDALNSVNGAKTLVLDPSIASPLGLVTEVSLLKHHGVDKMFWLEPGPLSATTTNIVYLCRPSIKNVKITADHVKRHAKESAKHTYTLLLVPRTSILVERILEEEGVLGEVNISSYNLQFIPIARDVISLEYDNAFKEIWVDGDESAIYNSAQALLTLRKICGPFPRIIGKGDRAARLATLLDRSLLPSSNASHRATLTGTDKIDSLIVLDRRVDMITPLLTQLTYEGLIDEMIGIKNSHIEVPISLLSPPNPTPANASAASTSASTSAVVAVPLSKEKKKKHHLTAANDPLFGELRDLNFASVGKRLNRTAHKLDADYKARLKAQTVAQLRDFVGKLGGLQTEHQALRLHTGLSEMIVPETRTDIFNKSLEIQQNLLASYNVAGQISAVEDLIAQGADMQLVIRLLCLASITSGGIKTKTLENIKREILQSYGYNFLPLLLSLSAPPLAVLLPSPLPASTPPSVIASRYPYTSLRKSLRLLMEDTDGALDEVENDIGYVYSGYAPISIRLVQCVAQKGGVLSNPALEREKSTDTGSASGKTSSKVQAHPIVGWKGFEDVLAVIPGEIFDIVPKDYAGHEDAVSPATSLLQARNQTSTTVVFFLGGCTYTEIAALRWVSRQNKGRNFLIATTGIISGNSLVDSVAGIAKGSNGSKDAGL